MITDSHVSASPVNRNRSLLTDDVVASCRSRRCRDFDDKIWPRTDRSSRINRNNRNTAANRREGQPCRAAAVVSSRSQNAVRAVRACSGRPLLSVGLIARRRRPIGRGSAPPRRQAVHRTHEYNWSIATARALSISHSI